MSAGARQLSSASLAAVLRCWLVVVVALIVLPDAAPAQITVEGFAWPTYYKPGELAPGQTNLLRMLLTGREAEIRPDGTVLVRQMRIEHRDGFGRTNLIAHAPDCLLNQTGKTATSSSRLSLDGDNGLLLLHGDGFFCNLTNMVLQLSNNVETLIREDMARVMRTNQSRPRLPGAGGPLTSRLQTNAAAGTNYIRILAGQMSFAYTSNAVTYTDNVRVDSTQFEMACEQLDGRRGTNGALENIVAQREVVLFNKVDRSSFYGDLAIYGVEEGRETVVLSGERARWQDSLREALARRFSFDLTEQRFHAEGNAYFKVPRMAIGQQSLLPGPSGAGANARTNAPEGDLEITADVVTAQLPTTNHPTRTITAVSNVVITSAADRNRATGDQAKYSEALGTLEIAGNAFWQTGDRIIAGDSLFADRSNRVFAVRGNTFVRLPASELGRQALLSPFLSGRTNLAGGTSAAPQFIELWCDDSEYRGDALTFRERIRGRFLEGTNALGSMTCGLLLFRFNSNQVESVTARQSVHIEQLPYTATNGVTTAKSLDCEWLNVLLATNGWIRRVLAETNVAAVQVERTPTNAAPIKSSLQAHVVVGEFFTHTNRLRELVAMSQPGQRDVIVTHDTRKGQGQRGVYNVTNNIVELTGQPTADFPDGPFTGKITEAEALIYDLGQKKFTVLRPRAQGERVSNASTNQSNLPLPR